MGFPAANPVKLLPGNDKRGLPRLRPRNDPASLRTTPRQAGAGVKYGEK